MPADPAPAPALQSSRSALSSSPSSTSVGMLPGAFPARALGAHLARYGGALATSKSSQSRVLSSTPSNSSNASSTYWGSVGSISSSRKLGSFASLSEVLAGQEQDAAEQQQGQLAGQSFKHQSSIVQEASCLSRSGPASRTGSCLCDTMQQHMHSAVPLQQHMHSVESHSQQLSAEDGEVAAVTSGIGAVASHTQQQQQGLDLLHQMELLLAHKTRGSGCTSAPAVLAPGSSGSCTPCGRRSCNALELAAMTESYTPPLLSPAGKQQQQQLSPAGKQLQQQQLYPRPVSTASVLSVPSTPTFRTTNSSCSSLTQQLQQLSAASLKDAPQPSQQRVRQVQSALPARVQISRDVKQQMLVESPSSPQLLPHTQSRTCALVSAVPDSLGGLDLDHALSQASVQAGRESPTGGSASVPAAQRNTCPARPSRTHVLEAASTASASADQHATAAVQNDPVVLVLPPRRPVLHHASTSHLPDSCQSRLPATHPEVPRAASALAGSGAAGAAAGLGRQMSAASLHVPAAPSPSAADTACAVVAITAASSGFELDRSWMRRSKSHPNIPACQLQQQPQPQRQLEGPGALVHSPGGLSSRSLSACRSRHLVDNSPSRSPAHGCRNGPGFNTTNSDTSAYVKPAATGAGASRSSTGAKGRAGEPVGPLELDPCAPPLHTAKLSKPDLVDVDYIVHRWSHRWQCDRERQQESCPSVPVSASPRSIVHQQTTGTGALVAAAAAAGAGVGVCSSSSCSSAVWVRPPEELHLFGASSLDAILQQQRH